MSTSFGFLSTSSWWGALAPVGINRYPTAPAGPPTVSQVNAFGAFSDAILSAFGKVATGSATAGTDAARAASAPNRVGAVALALKQALEASNGSPDAVAGVLGKIQSALDAASQALAGAGFSSDQIQAFTDQFKSALGAQLDALANQLNTAGAPAANGAATILPPPVAAASGSTGATPTTTGTGSDSTGATGGTTAGTGTGTTGGATNDPTSAATSSGAFEVSYRLSASGALRLVTAEGDIVNISFRATEKGTAIGASASGAAGLAAYAAISQTDTARFRISVQGSLNADELKAVNDVLGQVDALATQFFQGNVSNAFASAASLNVDPTEIAGLSLRLNESARFSLTAVGGPTAAAPATTDVGGATGSTAGSTTSDTTAAGSTTTPAATGGTATTPSTTSSTDSSTTASASTPASTDPATAPATTDAASGSTLPSGATGGGTGGIFDYLRQVLDAIGTPTSAGSVTISAKAKLTLLASAVGNASLTPTEAGAADFLKRIFGTLADRGTTGGGTTPATGTAATTSAAA